MTASPSEIRLAPSKETLSVSFGDKCFELSAELLRVESPSAEVKGHAPGQKKIVPGKKDVIITDVTPMGNYAIQLTFSDGHKTGIYSWDYLYELGQKQDEVWAKYLTALKEQGGSREINV